MIPHTTCDDPTQSHAAPLPQAVFGDQLMLPPPSNSPKLDEIPSPDEMKRRVIVKAKAVPEQTPEVKLLDQLACELLLEGAMTVQAEALDMTTPSTAWVQLWLARTDCAHTALGLQLYSYDETSESAARDLPIGAPPP